jgi:CreA protein
MPPLDLASPPTTCCWTKEKKMKTVKNVLVGVAMIFCLPLTAHAQQAEDPELIFKKNTVFHLLSPDAKLATYVIDDPQVDGVSCYFTVPEAGGWSGWAGFAEQRSETSIACRQIGPATIKAKFAQGENIYEQRRSFFFKTMHIVRGCDPKRNVLVYLSYTDKLVDGSPQNSTSTVPLMPWGNSPAPQCKDFVTQ